MFKLLLYKSLIVCCLWGFSQPADWFLLSPESDSVYGASVDKAYDVVKGKKASPVIVAVIDSGIDIEHEDLQGKLWKNEKELAGNGLDDDGNGYVDDVYGWNFIGGANGENVIYDTYELTREYVRLKDTYAEGSGPMNEEEAGYWQEIQQKYQNRASKAMKEYAFYRDIRQTTQTMAEEVMAHYETEDLTKGSLDTLKTEDGEVKKMQSALKNIMTLFGIEKVSEVLSQLDEAVEHFEVQVKYGYNPTYNPRTIIGDDFSNPEEIGYGNTDVEGEFAEHGTHVAGIIGADRNNDLGIRGVADHVKIMALRVVPNGDERDKDVANAIRYAVDNGARVINMSFGKSFEYRREIVDAAIDYAGEKNVLLVQGAGNSNNNSDLEANYPTPIRAQPDTLHLPHYIAVGATTWELNASFVADFSNYGKRTVDLFAPGVDLNSTVPQSDYKPNSGTSMASPVVAGVAALILSYYPELSAVQVRDILLESARRFPDLEVVLPGTPDSMVPFESLSISGSLVDAAAALELAAKKAKKVR